MSIKQYISDFLKNGNVFKNDIVLVHSNISKLYKELLKKKYKFNINDILEIFIDYIGINGTLIFPTFNFDFCRGKDFSIKDTPSQMGVLTELARVKALTNRTWHPVYSFVLFGNIPTQEIKKKNYSAYGKESIFNWITEVDGKIAIINLSDQNSMTYYHHVEELLNVDWRYKKQFYGNYTDFTGNIEKTEATIFVRDLKKGIQTDVTNMEKILWSKNLYKSKKLFSNENCRSINVKKLKKEVSNIIKLKKAEGVLYCKKN